MEENKLHFQLHGCSFENFPQPTLLFLETYPEKFNSPLPTLLSTYESVSKTDASTRWKDCRTHALRHTDVRGVSSFNQNIRPSMAPECKGKCTNIRMPSAADVTMAGM